MGGRQSEDYGRALFRGVKLIHHVFACEYLHVADGCSLEDFMPFPFLNP